MFLLCCALAVARCGCAQDTVRLSLLFLGDIMQHDSQIADARLSDTAFDYRSCFRWMAPLLHSADFTIGNLELTLGGPPFKGYPLFSAPDALARDLKAAGTNVLVTANNHSMDRGRRGLERTIEALTREGLLHTGTFLDSADRARRHPLWLEKNGLRVALLNYTYGTNGIPVPKPNIVNRIDTTQIKADLDIARRGLPDAVVVFFHWGDEYRQQPNAWQRKLADWCFREGVSVVVGAHPHVLQPMVWHRPLSQLAAYSLGNFVSGQQSRYRDGGATLSVVFEKTDGQTRIVSAQHDLHWVYRAGGRYQMLPAWFEGDTLLVRAETSRARLRQFVADSRALLSGNELAVPEAACDAHAVFRVWLSSGSDSLQPDALWQFFAPEQVTLGRQNHWVAGTFFDPAVAIQAALDIAAKTPYRHAAVLRRCPHP
jgi:poly-gamma-glutamate synthesis protein (capsule biosynthesis protein)